MSKPGLLLKALRTILTQRAALERQRSVMDVLHVAIEQKQRELLEVRREFLMLAEGFRISQEQPEVDLRDSLDALIAELRDQVAIAEEHVA